MIDDTASKEQTDLNQRQHDKILKSIGETVHGQGIRASKLLPLQLYIKRKPERGDAALEVLGPHLKYMKPDNILIPWRPYIESRIDLLDKFVSFLPMNERILSQLVAMASEQGNVDAFGACNKQAIEIVKQTGEKDLLKDFYGLVAKKALQHALNHAGAGPDKFSILNAILNLPDALDVKVKVDNEMLDWIEAVIAISTKRHVPLLDQITGTIDILLRRGALLQNPGAPCMSLLRLINGYGVNQRVTEMLGVLLERDADWEGLGLEKHERLWNGLQSNPRARMRMLEQLLVKDNFTTSQKNKFSKF